MPIWNLLGRVWGSSPEPETDEEQSRTYDDPPIYFTSQGERYVYPDDLMCSNHAQNRIKRFENLAKAQNLKIAQGINRLSSEE